MPNIHEQVKRLRELLAKATAGPWELQDGCSWRRIGTREHDGNVLRPDTYSREDRHPDLRAGKGEDLYANLTLIVEAINALPGLLDTLESLTLPAEGEMPWLIAQLEAWPERVDREKTTNIQYLMQAAAAQLRLSMPSQRVDREAAFIATIKGRTGCRINSAAELLRLINGGARIEKIALLRTGEGAER